MEINRLSKDELEYELAIRGVTNITGMDEMRRMLRQLMKLSKSTSFVMPSYPYTFGEDTLAIESKIKSISVAIGTFSGSRMSTEFQKNSTGIAWTIARANRCVTSSDDQNQKRSQWLVQLVGLSSQLITKAKMAEKSNLGTQGNIFDLSAAVSDVELVDSSDTSEDEPAASSSRREPEPYRKKPIPVSSWGLKFSGHQKEMSVNAFLERVNELRVARHTSEELLFQSAVDLFTNKALIWYRANRTSFVDWSDLARRLKEEFLSPDYDDKLFEEIKHRTQGSQESIGIYISIMKNLFSRLSVKISETMQVKIVLKNLSPFYQTQLGLVDITSIDQLLKYGRQLEARKAYVEAYVPPPNKSKALEPDLAYVDVPNSSKSVSSVSTTYSPQSAQNRKRSEKKVTNRKADVNLTCWNCSESGHKSAQCTQVRKKHCYRCGQAHFTVATCPKCSKASGNDKQTR